MTPNREKKSTKLAFVFSAALLIIWFALGVHSTVAIFTDADEAVNDFVFGDVELEVNYLAQGNHWKSLEASEKVFDDAALYEPGYTQVARLQLRNIGSIEFEYRLAVTINSFTTATSVLGNEILLSEYLKFGVVFADSIEDLNHLIATREAVRKLAITDMVSLNHYFEPNYIGLDEERKHGALKPKEECYAALVVYMPEEIGNEANYRGDTAPMIELGINVLASQRDTLKEIDKTGSK